MIEIHWFQALENPHEKAARQLACGKVEAAIETLFEKKESRSMMLKKSLSTVDDELEGLCGLRNPSVLRGCSKEELLSLSTSKIEEELKQRAPSFVSFLTVCATSKQMRKDSRRKSKIRKHCPSLKVVSPATILLKARCKEMNAWQIKNALRLQHGGCSTMSMNALCRQFVTVSPSTVRMRKRELGKGHDQPVKIMMQQLQSVNRKDNILKTLSNEVKKTPIQINAIEQFLPIEQSSSSAVHVSVPMQKSIDWIFHLPTATTEFQTINPQASEIEWSFVGPPSDEDRLRRVRGKCKDLEEKEFTDTLLAILATCKENGENNITDEMIKLVQDKLHEVDAKGYQIIGDNIDLLLKVKHMAAERQNRDIHWFHLYALFDDVPWTGESEYPQRNLKDIPLSEFLVNSNDVTFYNSQLVILWSRIITQYMPNFECLKPAVIRHIPHKYNGFMRAKSKWVMNCQLL